MVGETFYRLRRLADHKTGVGDHVIFMRNDAALRLKPKIGHGLRDYHGEKDNGDHWSG